MTGWNMKKLFGVITAMTTPFDKSGRVDTDALEKQTEFLISKKVNCLYPCGTTGEMYLMSAEERELVAETVVKKAAGRVTVFIHTGAMSQEETLRLSRHALKTGADGIGIVTPSYFKVSDRAMVMYYCEIAKTLPGDFPLYAYNIPQLSGNDISPEVLDEITSKNANIVGIKYSYADVNRLLQYLNLKNGSLSVVFGPDQLFLPALAMGCDGTVSGCSGALPEVFTNLYLKFLAGDIKAVQAAQFRAAEAVRLLRFGSDMAIFKAVLSARGIPGGCVRKPLAELDEDEKQKIVADLRKFWED
jgi:4-hydroxy-tetrahydrodipicolinate synthase